MGTERGVQWLDTVVTEMRRLGVTELQDRQRRVVLGPVPQPQSLPLSELLPVVPPSPETDPDEDLYAATGLIPFQIPREQ